MESFVNSWLDLGSLQKIKGSAFEKMQLDDAEESYVSVSLDIDRHRILRDFDECTSLLAARDLE